MKPTVIEGGVSQWAEQSRKPGDTVTIKHSTFSTITISGELVQLHPNRMATIKNPCGDGVVSGEYIPPMIRKK